MEVRIAELVALLILLICMFLGLRKGLLLKLYSIVQFVLILVVAILLVPILMPLIPETVKVREGVAFILAFIVAGIGLAIVANLLKIVNHIPVLNTVNRLGGALLGLVEGVLIVWVALLLIGAFQDVEWCRYASGYIRESEVLMAVQQYNPLPQILKNFDFPII